MARITGRRPSSSSIAIALAATALFVSLGGAALAVHVKLGKNDVKAKNIKRNAVSAPKIKDGSVGSAELGDASVGTAELGADAVNGGKVGDNSLTGADIDESTLSGVKADSLQGVDFFKAQTARLSDTVGGSAASQDLFTIGRVTIAAFCSAESGGVLRGGVEPVVQSDGATLVNYDSNGLEQVVPLHSASADFIVIKGSDTGLGQIASFAILDNENASATGIAAVSLNPASGRCVISAHAIG